VIIQNFTKNVEKLRVLINSVIDNGYLHKENNIRKTTLRRITLRKINFSEGIYRKIVKGVLCLNISLLKIVSFIRKCGKIWYRQTQYGRGKHTTHDNMVIWRMRFCMVVR